MVSMVMVISVVGMVVGIVVFSVVGMVVGIVVFSVVGMVVGIVVGTLVGSVVGGAVGGSVVGSGVTNTGSVTTPTGSFAATWANARKQSVKRTSTVRRLFFKIISSYIHTSGE